MATSSTEPCLQLSVPAEVPINNFWSVLVYDALSRSELQNSQPFPSVSMFGNPSQNADGTTDIYFGPDHAARTGKELDRDDTWAGLVPDLSPLRAR